MFKKPAGSSPKTPVLTSATSCGFLKSLEVPIIWMSSLFLPIYVVLHVRSQKLIGSTKVRSYFLLFVHKSLELLSQNQDLFMHSIQISMISKPLNC